jgi:hypothetical protein
VLAEVLQALAAKLTEAQSDEAAKAAEASLAWAADDMEEGIAVTGLSVSIPF